MGLTDRRGHQRRLMSPCTFVVGGIRHPLFALFTTRPIHLTKTFVQQVNVAYCRYATYYNRYLIKSRVHIALQHTQKTTITPDTRIDFVLMKFRFEKLHAKPTACMLYMSLICDKNGQRNMKRKLQ